MAEEIPGIPASAGHKQSAPAGVATEITVGEPLTAEANAAFGNWLKEKLDADPDMQERVALQSGLPASELSRLLAGDGASRLNRDQVQRIASALVELRIIPHADEAWTAAGLGSSDYVAAPMQVVQAMSQNA